MKLRVYKVREGAKLPERSHPSDAGMDLFFCPDDGQPVNILERMGAVLGTGLKIGVPPGFMLEIKNRSSVASRKSLVVGACVVDSGYDGEIFVNLNNIGWSTQMIEPGLKIAQAVLVPINTPEIEEIHEDNVYGGDTSRGSGGFGSTGQF